MKKIVLVGRDKAPSIAFDALGEALYKEGHSVHSFIGHGKPINVSDERFSEEMMDADVIVTGNSSSQELARLELRASEFAFLNAIPLVWYSDLFGNAGQEHFRELENLYGKEPAMIWTMDEYEKTLIEKTHQHSVVVITGNYGMEEQAFPEWNARHARTIMGVKNGDKMILVVGGKDKDTNLAVFEGVTRALFNLHVTSGMSIKVFLCMHPGDENSPDIYRNLERNGARRFSIKLMTRVEYERGFTTSRVFIGADGIISTGSTIEFGAFYWNIPVITIFTPDSLNRYAKAAAGRTKWGPAELGASYAVYNFKNDYNFQYELGHLIHGYIFGCGRMGYELKNKMIENQKKFYPRPEERTVIKKMMESLRRFL